MSQQIAPPQNTFVVRFWWEWAGEERPTGPAHTTDETGRWRGRVEHVQSGQGVAFRDARQLFAFMQRFVQPLQVPMSSEPRDGTAAP